MHSCGDMTLPTLCQPESITQAPSGLGVHPSSVLWVRGSLWDELIALSLSAHLQASYLGVSIWANTLGPARAFG